MDETKLYLLEGKHTDEDIIGSDQLKWYVAAVAASFMPYGT